MYVGIETERLKYTRICLHKKELRSEQYISLREALNADGNGNTVV